MPSAHGRIALTSLAPWKPVADHDRQTSGIRCQAASTWCFPGNAQQRFDGVARGSSEIAADADAKVEQVARDLDIGVFDRRALRAELITSVEDDELGVTHG